MGRPSNYKAEYAEQALKLCRLGATDKELGDFFGVSEQTINTWKQKHKPFLESLKRGKSLSDAEVADKLYQKATGYEVETVKVFQYQGQPVIVPVTEKYPPDTTAAIFWLKNRQRDKWTQQGDGEKPGDADELLKKLAEGLPD